jgi:putative transposase
MVKIKTVFQESDETYGSPRVYRALKAQGVACSENRVARLMRLRGLRAKQVRRFRATTKRNKAHRAAPNRLKRDFTAKRPNQKWLADGRPFGRLVDLSLDMAHHQGWVS